MDVTDVFLTLWHWGLNSGPTLELPQPFSCDGFFEIGSRELFPRLTLNHDPPDLCLLSGWDYRREPLAPACIRDLKMEDVVSSSGDGSTHPRAAADHEHVPQGHWHPP
jgi:hypothetical protein